jgi:hypothetical protein
MSEKVQIHVDTTNTTNVVASQQSAVVKINSNPFQCTYNFANQNRHARSISLQTAEIPQGFYNVRAPFNTLVINDTPRTITPGNYNSLTALNAAILVTAGSPALSSIGSFSSTNGIVTFTSAGGSVTFGPVTRNSLLSFLGYTHTGTTDLSTTQVASNPYTLTWDTYISIFIENIGTSSLENSLISFKIPLSSISNGTIFWSEMAQNKQIIQFQAATRLSYLNIGVYDRFGNILNNNGLDWSMTLNVDFVN